MKPLRHRSLVALAVVLTSALVGSSTPGAAPPPSLLSTLRAEMDRNLEVLKKEAVPPYFIAYSVSDVRETTINASFGALQFSGEDRRRVLNVDVRVGSYDLDNTHPVRGARSPFAGFSFITLPVDDDPLPIRQALWRSTDRTYKQAVEALTRVKTSIATKVKEETVAADFSREQPQVYSDRPATYTLDTREWEQRLRRITALLADDPLIYIGDASFSVQAENKYFVTSEGTELLCGGVTCRLGIQLLTKASDGMELPLYQTYWASTPAGLPREDRLVADVRTMMKQAAALRAAPVVEPYSGPALLSGRAAAVFFHEIFGHRVEGHRQKNVDEAQTFAKQVGKAVLPDFISVQFDPTLRSLGGQELAGYYTYDDEGVKAQRVTVVDKGILKSFLMNRSPIDGFPQSNGHGRAEVGRTPVSRQSNLIVESSRMVPYDQLLDQLRSEVRKQGKPFGLLFENIEGGFTFTGRTVPNAFTVIPNLVYRVYADNRPPELVRGVDIIGTPLTAFGKIEATSDKPEIFNGFCGAESGSVPVAAISPALLVSEVEVQKKVQSQDMPPILPAPDRRKTH